MSIFEAVFLGIVQGLAEFLPISSSGHLTLFKVIFGINEPGITYDVFLHVATLIPVLVIFRDDILSLIRKPFQKTTYLLICGTLPLVVIALLFNDTIEKLFESGVFLGVCFLITGIILMLGDSVKVKDKTLKTMKFSDSLFIGVIQGLAVVPAISRSGSTICASLFAGLNKEAAARFSFLLSIPAILGGLVLELKSVIADGTDFFALGLVPMTAGFIAAMISGFFAIKVMLRVIRTSKLIYFAYYVSILGSLIIFDQAVFHIFF